MARKILFFVPDNPLAAFISTGVLARCLKEDEDAVCHIFVTPQTAEFFDDLPAKKIIHMRAEHGGLRDWFKIMRACIGKYWHRVIDGHKGRFASFFWARHRFYFFLPEHLYSLPDPVRPARRVTGCLWVEPNTQLPLPQSLAPDAPLVVIGASRAHQGMQDIAANLPAGQVSLIEDASVGVRAALLRRATLCVGTDRLTARMAWVAATRHIVRLDARDEEVSVPYELHAGKDVAALADILADMRVKSTTNTFSFANQR